jgi:hypothetical protein
VTWLSAVGATMTSLPINGLPSFAPAFLGEKSARLYDWGR